MRNRDGAEAAVEEAVGEVDFAEREFFNFCDANDIDHAEEDMEEDERKDFCKIKKRFMKAVNEKRVVVDGCKLVYTVSKFSPNAGDEITVSPPIGKDMMAMDGIKDTHQVEKFQAYLASITKQNRSAISRLAMRDWQFLQDIAVLFLGG
jgi:hypothetical protein